MLRRWIAVVLMCWLPLQAGYAVAASYCAHETGAATHVGHHEHKHVDDRSVGDPAALNPAGVDADCAQCHLGCAGMLCDAAAPGSIGVPHSAPITFDADPAGHHPDALERVPLPTPLAFV
jgi:hypothetical protein